MKTIEIVQAIDEEISKLRQARAILAGTAAPNTATGPAKRRGRPKGSGGKTTAEATAPIPAKTAKKRISAEGRARIVAALKARWAAKSKAAAAEERAAKKGSTKSAKTAAKVVAKKSAKSAVNTSSAKKATAVKKAAEPRAEMATTSV